MQKEYKSRFVEIMTKFIVFSVTSGAGTVVDLGVHWLLSARFFTDSYWWGLWISPFISFELAVLVNFLIAYNYVWRERISKRGARSFWRHYAAYNATNTGVFFFKLALMQGLHFIFVYLNWFQDASYEPVLCNLLALCVSGIINFFVNEFVIFRKIKK